MPLLTLTTNLVIEPASRQLLARKASAETAALLGKSENYVMVKIDTGVTLLFAGDDRPAALLELKSLGLPEQRCAEFSATLCQLVEAELGIPPERIYIEFGNPPRHLWGWNGKTF